MTNIKVKCDRALKRIPMSKLQDFQGDLKNLTDEAMEKLKKSILTKGFRIPIFTWRKKILDGHQRLAALQELIDEGYKFNGGGVPCVPIVADNEQDAKELLLLISSRYGRMTIEGLNDYLEDLDIELDELATMVDIPEIDLDAMINDINSEITDGDDAVSPLDSLPSVAKIGDLWELGEHRVLCGDATDKACVEALCADRRANLMVTDPPYGVEYDPSWRKEAGINKSDGRMGMVSNDNRVDWSEAYSLIDAQVCYVWHAGKYAAEVKDSLNTSGYEIISQIIWVKDQYALSRGDYHWKHEPCWYAVKKGCNHNWQVGRDQQTVWEINRVDKNEKAYGHGTQKPLECMLKPIINNSSKGDIVSDPFLGSGTTLIACEKTKRKCYGMEIDPRYCDVIVKRYIDFCALNEIECSVKLNGKEFDIESY